MRIDAATRPASRPTTVEPSRAWILGLVVDADGSVSAPAPADSEWPSPAAAPGAQAPATAVGTAGKTMTPDGPTVRP